MSNYSVKMSGSSETDEPHPLCSHKALPNGTVIEAKISQDPFAGCIIMLPRIQLIQSDSEHLSSSTGFNSLLNHVLQ